MRPAIICATIAAIITATLASPPALIIGRDRRVWPCDYPFPVSPHTVTYASVVFTGLPTGCALISGCRCYRWAGTVHVVRWPAMQPGDTSCINITVRLNETSDSVVPLAALLPVAEIPILWPVVRSEVCGRAQTGVKEALTEITVAASVRVTEICARAVLVEVERPPEKQDIYYFLLFLGVSLAGVVLIEIHSH